MLKHLIAYYDEMDAWMVALTVTDSILFILFLVSVAYLALFSFLAMFSQGKHYKKARNRNRFVIIFPVQAVNESIKSSIGSFMAQDYPRELFDLLVVAPTAILDELSHNHDITVVGMEGERFSKRVAILHAMRSLDAKAYNVAIVMDAGNIVDGDFLTELNNAYGSGCKAIQVHCKAKSATTDTALFEAASQEINNSIFRRGHVRLGLSSALAGSGMVFDFGWLKQHIETAQGDDLEKQLEMLLLEQNIFIEYLNHVYVYQDKDENPAEFYAERRRWMATQYENIRMAVTRLPNALFSWNLDYCDKLFQWVMPSRTIILGALAIISVILLFLSWPMSLKWWGLLFFVILSFSMAMPDYMIDARFVRAIKTMPLLFTLTVFNMFRKRLFKVRVSKTKTTV